MGALYLGLCEIPSRSAAWRMVRGGLPGLWPTDLSGKLEHVQRGCTAPSRLGGANNENEAEELTDDARRPEGPGTKRLYVERLGLWGALSSDHCSACQALTRPPPPQPSRCDSCLIRKASRAEPSRVRHDRVARLGPGGLRALLFAAEPRGGNFHDFRAVLSCSPAAPQSSLAYAGPSRAPPRHCPAPL